MKNEELTIEEKKAINVLNFVAQYDGIMNESDIKYILSSGIKKYIPKKKQHLVSITETAYPIRIKIKQL